MANKNMHKNEFWHSAEEWADKVPGQLVGIVGILASVGAFIWGMVALITKTRHVEPPLPWWDIGLLIGGALLFVIFSFLAFHKVRLERDKARAKEVKNDVAIVVEKLKNFTVPIGDKRVDAAAILYQLRGKLAVGMPVGDVSSAIRENFGEASNDNELINATQSIIEQLSLNQVIWLRKRREASGPRQYDAEFWILRDFGKKVIQHLDVDGKSIS